MQFSLLHHLRRNAVAYLALFVALGGTSFAAATVITGKNVKNKFADRQGRQEQLPDGR